MEANTNRPTCAACEMMPSDAVLYCQPQAPGDMILCPPVPSDAPGVADMPKASDGVRRAIGVPVCNLCLTIGKTMPSVFYAVVMGEADKILHALRASAAEADAGAVGALLASVGATVREDDSR